MIDYPAPSETTKYQNAKGESDLRDLVEGLHNLFVSLVRYQDQSHPRQRMHTITGQLFQEQGCLLAMGHFVVFFPLRIA